MSTAPLEPIRARLAPRTAPPESHASHAELLAATRPSPYVQGALAMDFNPSPCPRGALEESLDEFGPRPTPSVELPDPQAWGRRIALVIAEVLAGDRPPAQIVRWTAPEIHAQIARMGALAGRRQAARPDRQRRTVVRGVRSSQTCDGIAEVAAVIDDGRRARALALQLTGLDGRWRVTAWRLL